MNLFKRRKGWWLAVGVLGAGITLFSQPAVRSAVDRTYEEVRLLVDVLDLVRDNYVEEVPTKDLVYSAASGMVRTLDPFSQFLTPEAHKEMKTETEGEFGGLGIRIAIRDNVLTVITPLPETPAFRIGILPGDRILKIDGETTKDISMSDAVKKLRGNPGTKVTLSILHDAGKEPQDVVVTREVIKIQSVRHKMLEDDIGYLRILEFTQKTTPDVRKSLTEMEKKGMRSLILDLRNNPGGLLNVAVEVSRIFLGGNRLIVYTEGRRQPRQEFRADAKALYETLPIVILVNRGSASGSEILAGSLQDYKRAIILGSETFGKGSVQSVIPLADGSGLRLTTANYYTPSGRTFHRDEKTGKGGILPDIILDVSRELEAKLQAQSEEIYGPDKKPAPVEEKSDRVVDEALERARQLLKAREIFSKKD